MAPRLDKLTVKAQEALQAAQEMAARSGQQQIEPLHILWALVGSGRRRGAAAAREAGRVPDGAGERGRKADRSAAEDFRGRPSNI